jgi:hypothetical protein
VRGLLLLSGSIKAGLKRAVAQGVKLGRPIPSDLATFKIPTPFESSLRTFRSVTQGLARCSASQKSLAEGSNLFCFVADLYEGPGRGDFSISNFHPGLISGNLAKTIFGVREVAGAERGGLFWATSWGKKLSAA